MKLEIEITPEEIKSAIERRVRVAIADQNAAWNSEQSIKDKVRAFWNETVEATIQEILGDSAQLKEMIDKAVEMRVKARVAAALKSI